MTVRIELHTASNHELNSRDLSSRWRVTADVPMPLAKPEPGAPQDFDKQQYGGYGATPLEAAMDLATHLANTIGYERTHGIPQGTVIAEDAKTFPAFPDTATLDAIGFGQLDPEVQG